MSYGLPYQGSKSKIADKLLAAMPSGRRFVDLFAGGCAMTHCAMLSGKYECYLANDISDAPQLFLDAIDGKYHYDYRWISRDDFTKYKDSDAFIRICWSFGNTGEAYLYSRDLEPYKEACHYAICFDEWADLQELCPEVAAEAEAALQGIQDTKARRRAFGPAIVSWMRQHGTPELLKSNPLYRAIKTRGTGTAKELISLQSLMSLERLQRLERLGSLQSLEVTQGDYREYQHQDGDVVYCDPPYITASSKGKQYGNADAFNKDDFCEWARSRDYPIYISEYTMPADFIPVTQCTKQSCICAKTSYMVQEKLWLHEKWSDSWEQLEIDFEGQQGGDTL